MKAKSLELEAELIKTRANLEAVAEDVKKLSSSGTALEEQALCLEAARIEGILEAVTKLVGSDSGEEAAVGVLSAATDEAKRMVEESAESILQRSREGLKKTSRIW